MLSKVLALLSIALIINFTSETIPPCDHQVYCQGELLKVIQLSSIFNDSKTFVDMPSKYPEKEIVEKFQKLKNYSRETLLEFLSENFLPAGSEVVKTQPRDWVPNPQFLDNIKNEDLKQWATNIHSIWLDLFRFFQHNTSCTSCYSSLYGPRPFVVPGGRFREYYYWDNLWIVEGLLVSEMPETSLDIVANLLDMIDKYGFIWNGARIYYSKRSQPPVVSLMVNDIFQDLMQTNKSRAISFLNSSYPLLVQEYEYWMTGKRCFPINSTSKGDILNHLNCFKGFAEMPRPESYKEDFLLAEKSSVKDKSSFFREIAAGAETGWDFSSRFFADHLNMGSINVSRWVPVDLNSILYKVELTLAEMSQILHQKDSEKFLERSRSRKTALMTVLFDQETSQWRDVEIEALSQNPNFYLSNFIPLWAFDDLKESQLQKILEELDIVQKQFSGGMPTSLVNSTQQWDFPNAWPPLQDFHIFGLAKKKNELAIKIAKELAQKFIDNSFCGWQNFLEKRGKGAMLEKYDSLLVGGAGGGGEYEVQEGFGWSNGVALKILKHFGNELQRPDCSNTFRA